MGMALVHLYPMALDVSTLSLREFIRKYTSDLGFASGAKSDVAPTSYSEESIVEISFWADWHRGHEIRFRLWPDLSSVPCEWSISLPSTNGAFAEEIRRNNS